MPPSPPAPRGGQARGPAGTNIIFKSLGRKTTIKQPRLRVAGEFGMQGEEMGLREGPFV